MPLDQVLGLSTLATEAVVDPLSRAAAQADDDITDIEPVLARLNADDDAALVVPEAGGLPDLGVVPHHRLAFGRPSDADRVCDLLDLRERLGPGHREDVIDDVCSQNTMASGCA